MYNVEILVDLVDLNLILKISKTLKRIVEILVDLVDLNILTGSSAQDGIPSRSLWISWI